eukprot:TRINITY_DN23868_c0_g1_i1.p1 TRINITY_DN23868_c0_g1~~TRINITY_DN23868_c0_g1_i1.p1  ORF type:complete len:230 (-),score=42.98 TRINITY_DN23868_c0_g1_i1:249-884(-)
MPRVGAKKTKIRLTKSGQHPVVGGGCIATSLRGRPCADPRVLPGIPYCGRCMRSGDPSLKVASHPKFGKILVARRRLPKSYKMAWWGKLVPVRKLPKKKEEWALKTHRGMIDATSDRGGSLLQFCACPGPSEVPTVDFARNSDVLLRKVEKTSALFETLREIPKSHQLTMMYNLDEKTTEEFFQERGLVRGDVGTKRYPALRKTSEKRLKK